MTTDGLQFSVDDKRFKAQLEQLRKDMRGRALLGAMNAALTPIETTMKATAPVRKGILRGCIARVTRVYRGGEVVFGAVGTDTAKLQSKGHPSNLAWLLEYGHRIAVGGKLKDKKRGDKYTPQKGTGREAGRTKANGFMRVAFDATKDMAGKIAVDFLARVVEGKK